MPNKELINAGEMHLITCEYMYMIKINSQNDECHSLRCSHPFMAN